MNIIFLTIALSVLTSLLTMSIILLVHRWSQMRRAARKPPAGSTQAQAIILKIWDTGVTVDDDPQVGLLLEVQPSSRPIYRLEMKSIVPRSQVDQMRVGAVLPIALDLQDPARIRLLMNGERGN